MRLRPWPPPLRIAAFTAAIFLVTPCLFTLSVSASPTQEERLQDSPRFLLEKIFVERAETVSPEILLSESRLVEGRSYTEAQLRNAIHRIVRLPLILDAKPRLSRGSSPGSYRLAIEVIETRRWFFGFDVEATHWSEPIAADSSVPSEDFVSLLATVGRRFSVGHHGIFFAAVGGEDGTLQVGYTHYDLLGRGGLLAVSASASDCGSGFALPTGFVPGDMDPSALAQDGCTTTIFDLGLDPAYSSWSQLSATYRQRFQAVVPLLGNQSLRWTATRQTSQEGTRRPALDAAPTLFWVYRDLEQWRVDVGWVLNSVDDPTFPSEGRILEAGLELQTLQADLTPLSASFATAFTAGGGADRFDSRQVGLDFSAARYWPFGQEGTFSANGHAFFGRSSVTNLPAQIVEGTGAAAPGPGSITEDLDVVNGTITAGYSRFLRQTRSQRHWRQLRWESQLEAFYSSTSPDLGLGINPQRGFRVGTGLVYRTPWGLVRFSLNYQGIADS